MTDLTHEPDYDCPGCQGGDRWPSDQDVWLCPVCDTEYQDHEDKMTDHTPAEVSMLAVRVTPLVWENVPTGYGPETYEAVTAFGFYQVFADDDSCMGAVGVEFATNQQQFGTTAARSVARVHDFFTAKAAAQADYDARRAAIALAPDPRCCLGLPVADCATTPGRHCDGMLLDPRDAVIAQLVEALEKANHRLKRVPFNVAMEINAALAAAKVLMK